MELTDIQRIRKVIKWLIFSGFGENEKELAQHLGYTHSGFSQILNGKVPISDKFINNLIALDNNINKVWIKTGKQDFFIQPQKALNSTDENAQYSAVLEKQVAFLEEKIAFLEQKLKQCEKKK